MQEENKQQEIVENTEEQHLDVMPNQPLSDDKIQQLRKWAIQFEKIEKETQSEFENSTDQDQFYLLSSKWLKRWKAHISYDEVINQKPLSKFMGGPVIGNLNEDLIDLKKTQNSLINYPKTHDFYNVYLKQNLQENRDFLVVGTQIVAFFHEIYKDTKEIQINFIRRPVYQIGTEQKIEVYFRQFCVLYVDNDHLYELDPVMNKRKEILKGYMQFSSYIPIKELYRLLEESFRKVLRGVSQSGELLRIWKLSSQIKIPDFTQTVIGVLKQTSTRDYQIQLQGLYVDREREDIFDELHNEPEDIFIFEIKLLRTGWCFKNEQQPMEEQCESCYQYRILKFKCVCAKVAYCSETCQIKDTYWHSNRCEKAGEEDQKKLLEMKEESNSRNGVVGLKNLGNTCFMNSSLQCLTQIPELVEYFLSRKYLEELNLTNPIGSKGKVARAFAHLIIQMFFGADSQFAPHEFKRAIGAFQTMFSGYSQHDSHQLTGFVLDAIHEDLNRIKAKPVVENQDSNNREDFVVAQQHWDNFKKRNDSIIVDMMFGQSKSKLECPDCNKISITFDPFLALSLPIPQNQSKQVTVLLQSKTAAMITKQFTQDYQKDKPFSIKDLKEQIAKELKTKGENLMMKMVTNYYYELDPKDDESTNTIRKECKYKKKNRKLTCRELFDWETAIPETQRQHLFFRISTCYSSYYQNSDYRREITLIRGYYFDKRWTLKQVHLKLFQHFYQYFNQLSDQEKIEEVYQELVVSPKEKGDQALRLLIVSNSQGSWYNECYFCGEKRCSVCDVPFDAEMTLGDYLKNIPEKSDYQPEFQLFVRKINNNGDPEQMFDKELQVQTVKEQETQSEEKSNQQNQQEQKEQEKKEIIKTESTAPSEAEQETVSQSQVKTVGEITVYDCLDYNKTPEILNKDNAWYCSNCQQFRNATQTMDIYKAPRILIIHLKRFKGRTSYYRQKQTALVHFPLQGLDLKNYVLNHRLTSDFAAEEKERLEQKEQNETEPKGAENIYDLYGISNHFGNLGGGHYTAFVKNYKTGKWYNHDDSHVTEIQDTSRIVTQAAYMLFYRLRE